MSHFSDLTFSRYLDGELSLHDRHTVEKHLVRCRECAGVVDEMRRLDARIISFAARRKPLPVATEHRIRKSVDAISLRKRWSAFTHVMPAALGSSIAALLILVSANAGWLSQRADRTGPIGNVPSETRILKQHEMAMQNARRLTVVAAIAPPTPPARLDKYQGMLKTD